MQQYRAGILCSNIARRYRAGILCRNSATKNYSDEKTAETGRQRTGSRIRGGVMIRIGTRGSDLALWQARRVAAHLHDAGAGATELVIVETQGDRIRDVPLTADLGRSFFTKDIETGLLEGRFDLAVHSLKDLSTQMPDGLCLAATTERADPSELILVRPPCVDRGRTLDLCERARVGSSSPRRRRFVAAVRPDVTMVELRGNVPTRLRKLRDGVDYDAILVAAAGVDRLGLDLDGLHVLRVAPNAFPCAPGQGALGLQTRSDDTATIELVRQLGHEPSANATAVERSLLEKLGGGCSMPLGAFCRTCADQGFELDAFLFGEAAPQAIRAYIRGTTIDEVASQAAATLAPAQTTPIAGLEVTVVRGNEPTDLEGELAAAGARVTPVESYHIVPQTPTPADVAAIREADCVLVASRAAARVLATNVERIDATKTLVAAGRSTARALALAFPANTVLLADPPRGEGLGRTAIAHGAHRCVLAGAAHGSPGAGAALEAHDIPLTKVTTHSNTPTTAQLRVGDRDAIVLFASAAGIAAVTVAPGAVVGAIGPTTARTLEARGIEVRTTLQRPELASFLAQRHEFDSAGGATQ